MSEVVVKCTAEFRRDEQLTADRELTDFIKGLPADAVLSPITIDQGSQREPWLVLVGLRAEWEEAR